MEAASRLMSSGTNVEQHQIYMMTVSVYIVIFVKIAKDLKDLR